LSLAADAFKRAAGERAASYIQKGMVVGLGTGSLACHRQGREHWTFFEIDPEVIRIARDPRRFEFLSRCAPESPVIAGDARLTLEAMEKLGEAYRDEIAAFDSSSIL